MKRSTILLPAFALALTLVAATAPRPAFTMQGKPHAATARTVMEVYKSPTCGCCKQWVDHAKSAGFDTRVTDLDDAALDAKKASLGVAPRLQSCHTSVVGGYVIEGHVPAADIARLLKERPSVVGLAAPGMPRGSPGMEMPNGMKDAYDVVSFDKSGATKVFARH